MADLFMPILALPKQHPSENSSIHVENLSRSEYIVYQVVISFFGLIGTFGNLFTILALSNCSKLRQNSTTKFVLSLATSDLLFCSVSMTTFVWRLSIGNELNADMCPFIVMVLYVPAIISLNTLMAIAINRYVIVCHNAIYEKVYSNYKIVLKIVLIWFIGFGVLTLPLFELWGKFGLTEITHQCDFVTKDGKSPKTFIILFFTVLPMVIMIFCYTMIFLKIRHMKMQLNELHMKGNTEDMDILKMMFTLFICYIVSIIPVTIITAIDPLNLKTRLQTICGIIYTSQGIINPFIYAFKNSTYKPAFIKLCRKIVFCIQLDNSVNTTTGPTQATI